MSKGKWISNEQHARTRRGGRALSLSLFARYLWIHKAFRLRMRSIITLWFLDDSDPVVARLQRHGTALERSVEQNRVCTVSSNYHLPGGKQTFASISIWVSGSRARARSHPWTFSFFHIHTSVSIHNCFSSLYSISSLGLDKRVAGSIPKVWARRPTIFSGAVWACDKIRRQNSARKPTAAPNSNDI